MALDCPKCRLFSPDGSRACDCGFVFRGGTSPVANRRLPIAIGAYLAIMLVAGIARIYLVLTTPVRRRARRLRSFMHSLKALPACVPTRIFSRLMRKQARRST